MKIKDFNNFINHNEHVNERYIIEDLDILKYHLKEFKKFLYHETNKIGNTGLIIQLSENFICLLNSLKFCFLAETVSLLPKFLKPRINIFPKFTIAFSLVFSL